MIVLVVMCLVAMVM